MLNKVFINVFQFKLCWIFKILTLWFYFPVGLPEMNYFDYLILMFVCFKLNFSCLTYFSNPFGFKMATMLPCIGLNWVGTTRDIIQFYFLRNHSLFIHKSCSKDAILGVFVNLEVLITMVSYT